MDKNGQQDHGEASGEADRIKEEPDEHTRLHNEMQAQGIWVGRKAKNTHRRRKKIRMFGANRVQRRGFKNKIKKTTSCIYDLLFLWDGEGDWTEAERAVLTKAFDMLADKKKAVQAAVAKIHRVEHPSDMSGQQ